MNLKCIILPVRTRASSLPSLTGSGCTLSGRRNPSISILKKHHLTLEIEKHTLISESLIRSLEGQGARVDMRTGANVLENWSVNSLAISFMLYVTLTDRLYKALRIDVFVITYTNYIKQYTNL